MSDIFNLENALDMIFEIGKIIDKISEAEILIKKNRNSFQQCEQNIKQFIHRPKAVYFIWKDPIMVAASQTFIHEMLQFAGLKYSLQLNLVILKLPMKN